MEIITLLQWVWDTHIYGILTCQRNFNPLTPNDLYMNRTAPLTSKRCILYIYSTNVGTEYFKHVLYSPSFSLQNALCFTMLTSLVPVLFTFCIQDVLKLKKKSSTKGLSCLRSKGDRTKPKVHRYFCRRTTRVMADTVSTAEFLMSKTWAG